MTDNVESFPVTPAIHNRRVQAEAKAQTEPTINPLFEYIEPCPITDEVVTGCAKVEQIGHGLVRVWLYGTEDLSEKIKVIRAKLVMPAELAREVATKITAELS